MTPGCSCLRFMIHPQKLSSSFECDGCGHHACFHRLESLELEARVQKKVVGRDGVGDGAVSLREKERRGGVIFGGTRRNAGASVGGNGTAAGAASSAGIAGAAVGVGLRMLEGVFSGTSLTTGGTAGKMAERRRRIPTMPGEFVFGADEEEEGEDREIREITGGPNAPNGVGEEVSRVRKRRRLDADGDEDWDDEILQDISEESEDTARASGLASTSTSTSTLAGNRKAKENERDKAASKPRKLPAKKPTKGTKGRTGG
ncbi:MAG: hypothetical protein MMC33_007763 [Icmadophila ericetorum]|nr:hypothetical protein [Icmadophila ericetorum]